MAFKYPNEVYSTQRKDQAFVVDCQFSRATTRVKEGARPEPPLTMFSRYSRFVVAVIDTNKATKSVIANIPVRRFNTIRMRSEFAHRKHMEKLYSEKGAGADAQNLAYTVQLKGGYFKGKTPAEVLIENPGNVAGLEQQMNYLGANLQKYPKNQEQINAIQHAIHLLRSNMLSGEKANSMRGIVLYEATLRPLKSKEKHGNNWFIYDIKISWMPGETAPVHVTVSNYYAPVDVKADGRYNVMLKNKEPNTETVNEFSLTEEEWNDCLDAMDDCKQFFVDTNAPEAFKEWRELGAESRAEAGQKKGTNAPSYNNPQNSTPSYNNQRNSAPVYNNQQVNAPVSGQQTGYQPQNGYGNPYGGQRGYYNQGTQTNMQGARA